MAIRLTSQLTLAAWESLSPDELAVSPQQVAAFPQKRSSFSAAQNGIALRGSVDHVLFRIRYGP